MTLRVACVLRSGGVYSTEWVWRLHDALWEHLSVPFMFTVLSDRYVHGYPNSPALLNGWPGWWSKLELFRPGLFRDGERVLYLDLDTDVVGPLDDIAGYDGDMAMLSDFYVPERAQSGVMAWRAGKRTESLYRIFERDPKSHMHRFRGDGEFLHHHAGEVDRLQDLYPRQVASYKVHCQRDGVPPDARLVCYHGSPKRQPDDTIQ